MTTPPERRSPDRQFHASDHGQSGDWRSRNRRSRESRSRKYSQNFQSSEWFSRGYLPHRDGRDLIQHVTFHLADSLPKSAIDRIEESLVEMPEESSKAERRKRLYTWLDAGHGACVLKHPEVAEMVQSSLLHFDRERYRLHAWIVMPNHVHVLFQPINDWSMAKIVASWKKFTARKINDFKKADPGTAKPGSANLPIGPADLTPESGRQRPDP